MNEILAQYRLLAAQAREEQTVRRSRVLRHEDLRKRLTEPPIGYERPEQWSGYVAPKLLPQGGDDAHTAVVNTCPRRRALVALCAEALSRERAEQVAAAQ